MRDDVALSFDGADPYRTAANRRGGGGMSGFQGGPGGSSALPFMSFDLGNVSAPPPRVTSVGGYSGGGGGFGAFEDEAPLLEGELRAFFFLLANYFSPIMFRFLFLQIHHSAVVVER